jgi:hypothetical protein
MTSQELQPVPGWRGEYDLDNNGDVFTVGRTITRANGWTYTIRPRRRRWVRDHHTGLLYMKLARNGQYTDVWRHLLIEQVWGDTETQAAAA